MMEIKEIAQSDTQNGSTLLADKTRSEDEIAAQHTATATASPIHRPFSERRRSLVFTADDVEYPAAGRWEACRGPLTPGGDRLSEGSLVVAHGPSCLELQLVVGGATATVSLVNANRYGAWRFVGYLLIADDSHAIELIARYQGVFAAGAHPVALLSIVTARHHDATTWRARRRPLPVSLIGDLNLLAPVA